MNMVEGASLEFELRITDETINYLLHEIKQNVLMIERYKKTCKYLNYVEKLFILSLTTTAWVSFSAFASLFCVPVGIASFEIGTKIVQSLRELKKKKKYDKIVLLGKYKLNTIEVLISKALTDSYISHVEFVSVNNVLTEYN